MLASEIETGIFAIAGRQEDFMRPPHAEDKGLHELQWTHQMWTWTAEV